jgi:hypothetical protein
MRRSSDSSFIEPEELFEMVLGIEESVSKPAPDFA